MVCLVTVDTATFVSEVLTTLVVAVLSVFEPDDLAVDVPVVAVTRGAGDSKVAGGKVEESVVLSEDVTNSFVEDA